MNKSKQINNEEGFLSWYKSSGLLLKQLLMPKSFPCIVIWQNAHEDGFEDWHDSYEVVYLSDFSYLVDDCNLNGPEIIFPPKPE